jgi:hypothetical protein
MVEISNNLIAGLLLVAIVISAYSVVTVMNLGEVTITGYAGQETGTANVTVGGLIDIYMLRNVTNFGSDSLGGADQTINTQSDNPYFDDGCEGNATNYGTCDNTEPNCAFPFVVRNDGNVNVSIDLNASAEAPSWIATGAGAYVLGKANESGATNFTGLAGFGQNPAGYLPLNVSAEARAIENLGPLDPRDEGRIHIQLKMRSDTPAASYGEYLTLGALQIVT